MAETKKALPIGVEFFRDFKGKNYYYVDKTAFIADFIETKGIVTLITRPRRFGKSLNMDMFKSFFEIGADASLFDGLQISKRADLCEQHMGKYPVISISLKDVAGSSYSDALKKMSRVIKKEARRHQYLLESDRLTHVDKASLKELYDPYLDEEVQEESLGILSEMLDRHYGKPGIILIDEYDVPLDKAYQKNYYDEMTEHIRAMFSVALKTNPHLDFAVLTGCLRIAKESIFTGLNNFNVCSVSDPGYGECFGFTDGEVKELLRYYGVEDRFPDMKEWYDGYRFGDADIYCPWDVIVQCGRLRDARDAPMEPHWENSSSNAIVRDILEDATEITKTEIEMLISGEPVEKEIIPELTYKDLENKDTNIRQTYLWSILFATGYLTDAKKPEDRIHRLVIPNKEIRRIYEDRIRSWFRMKVTGDTERWKQFCASIRNGDVDQVQTLFNVFLSESISIRDTAVRKDLKETFYHGMLLGLLKAEKSWVVKSNAESGTGYADILIMVPSEKTGCVVEVKYAENGAFDAACHEAMEQIRDRGYTKELEREGMRTIHQYGLACYRKTCRMAYERG